MSSAILTALTYIVFDKSSNAERFGLRGSGAEGCRHMFERGSYGVHRRPGVLRHAYAVSASSENVRYVRVAGNNASPTARGKCTMWKRLAV